MPTERIDLRQAARSQAKAILSAALSTLSSKSVLSLIAIADRTRLSSRVSGLALNEAIRRLQNGNGGYPLHDQLFLELIDGNHLSAPQKARAFVALGTNALQSHQSPQDAVKYFTAAISLDPQRLAWRVTLLRAAAANGDRTTFYRHLTPEVTHTLGNAKLARLLGQLARTCRASNDWRAAADAFDHARTLEPSNEIWLKKLDLVRKQAPEWGFYSADPSRRWAIKTQPKPATGVVAPIISHFVTGWIPASFDDTRIEFKLNGVTVADARADLPVTLPDGHEYRQFSRMLKDVWAHAGDGDILTIQCSNMSLPIINNGVQFHFMTGQSRSNALLMKMDSGFVINKYGLLRPSIIEDVGWQARIFDLYQSLRHDLSQGLGLNIFPFYGTMLGAVREKNFIRHDNDFDTVYISQLTKPEEVRTEFKDVCKFLISRGYSLSVKKTHTWVTRPGRPEKLDLFYSWFNSADYYEVSYAYHGKQVRRSHAFFEFRTEKLGNFQIPVPLNAEQILQQLYGDGWRFPDPGFSHQRVTRVMDRRSLLTTDDRTDIYWDEFYRDHASERPSRFTEFVQSYFSRCGVMFEFGCGDGADARYFASRGWATFCCDRSAQAIAKAEAAIESPTMTVRFEAIDVGDNYAVKAFMTRNLQSTPVSDLLVIYLRFFLHAIDEPTQDHLLDALTSTINGEFYLCAEFRTIEDRHLAKVHSDHYRRYIDHTGLAERLSAQWNFDVQYLDAGTGLSPHFAEDPHLCRIVAFHSG